MPCAPASMLWSAARMTLGIPMFREFLSKATLFRFTLSRVMDNLHRHNVLTFSRKPREQTFANSELTSRADWRLQRFRHRSRYTARTEIEHFRRNQDR